MAPITDDMVADLKDKYHKLEARVWELEGRLAGDGGKKSTADSMRMILMGPPGAGMSQNELLSTRLLTYRV
jgi:adenylate kinase